MNKRSFRLCATMALMTAGFLVAAARPAFCWDKFGHEVITQIAYEHLNPSVKTQVNSLITQLAGDPDVTGLDSKYKPYNFVTAGAWMDDIKSISREFNTWHYIDLPFDNAALTSADVAQFTDANPSNAVHAIETFCIPNLTNTSAPVADRARALGFFLHLAGDLHQPLHTVGIDRGGNSYAVTRIPSSDPEWPVSNLHAFWDGAYRYSGKDGKVSLIESGLDLPRITAPGQDPIASFADEIQKDYAPTDPKLAEDANCADWALESKNIAVSFVYPAMNNQHDLTPDYVQKAHDIACRRLVLAGLREANVLNGLFGTAPTAVPAKL
jgi:hypothetical protein